MRDDYQTLKFERRGPVITVAMDNPPLNAVDAAMANELERVFDELARDNDSTVVVLTGAGRAFSAGGDFGEMLRATEDSELRRRLMSGAPRLVQSILGFDKPVIARLNGHAIGMGATLALMCDVVIAVQGVKIADPHVNIGLSAGDGGALMWPHLVGYARARHYLLTGEPLLSEEAANIGLIHKAVSPDGLDAEVYAYAERLAGGATLAIQATKKSINMALRAQATIVADAHMGLELLTMSSADHREAILAFKEKRTANFRGH